MIFILFSVLFSFSGFAEPMLLSNTSSTPVNYNFSFISEFTSTWTNTTGNENITACNFTLGRPDGSLTVYSITPNSTTPPSLCYKNFSQNDLGHAGNYNFTWSAKNDTNYWVTNDTRLFTTNKANLSFSITGSNVIYPSPVNIVTSESNNGDSDVNYTLYRNSSFLANFSTINGTAPIGMIELLPVSAYLYTFNTCAGTFQNYTTNTTGLNSTVTVSKGTPSVTLYINGGNYNKIVNINETVNLTAVSNVTGLNMSLDLNVTGYGNNFQNGTSPQTNLTDTGILDIGIFNFSAKVTGNDNYTDSSLGTLYFYVANFSVSPSSLINYVLSAPYNFSIILPVNSSNVIFEANFNGTYVNYTNSTNITNWNKIITMYNNTNGGYWINFTDLQATTYNYRWIVNDTNFSTDQKTYIVNQTPITPSFAIQGSSSWTTTTSTSVTLVCTVAYQANLTISGSGCAGTLDDNYATCTFTTPASAGSSIYSCLASGNYIGQTQQTLSWYIFTPNQGSGGSGGSNQTPSGSFTILSSSSSVTMEPNTSKVLTITLKNTFTGDITLINMTVTGINATWYSLDKTSIARLSRNGGNDTVKLTLNIPSDAERKIYTITVTAAGRDFNLNRLTRITAITLTIPPATQNATQNVTQNATQNATQGSNATTTTGSGVAGVSGAPTGLTISPEDFKNIVLFVGFLAAALIFIFRNNVTNVLMSDYKPTTKKTEEKKEETKIEKKEEKKEEKKSIFSKLRNLRLVIKFKEKEKEEKT